MVPLSKSGLGFSERGFESHPLRQPTPRLRLAGQMEHVVRLCFEVCLYFSNGEVLEWTIRHAWRACVAFGYRGFESHPLRFTISPTLMSNSL
jgi:hypothetical protein